ncbi:MAG: OmpH family outer membrane protein [Bacteroidales bacterium]|nr:OmpH family outer membrane protein [Bacteroidales bacterium]MBR7027153.1 OmpH family outer membrane protein [Bacteroidales bacterium]
MKKTSLILACLALLVSVATLIFTLLSREKKPVETEPTDGQTAVAGDIVYIQIDSLLMNYDMYNDLMSAFQSKYEASQNELQKKSRQLENDAKSFENQINKGLLTRSAAEQQQQNLLKRQENLQNEANNKQLELQEEQFVLNNQVYDAVKTFLEKYNQEHQFALILTTNASTNAVIEGSKVLDITEEVTRGLNEEYIRNRNK